MTSKAHFSISVPSSRAASPAPSDYSSNSDSSDLGYLENSHIASSVYDAVLPPWRATLRRFLVKMVERESPIIASMQSYIRTPLLDAYFVYTSSLGTHTFFMILLPAFFFFGYDKVGRALLIILALGVYSASVLKDLICSPRPFAPPVTRLTIGTHHLEYGFPSTHSTNSISIALLLWSEVDRLAHSEDPSISENTYRVSTIILSIYAVSIVFGRLYTAMHSFVDCLAGVSLGVIIWWSQEDVKGIDVSIPAFTYPLAQYLGALPPAQPDSWWVTVPNVLASPSLAAKLESWLLSGGYVVPLLVISVTLLAVNQHPQPVDDCPCFEDAIAFGGVVLGAIVGRWAAQAWGFSEDHVLRANVVMPGSGWSFSAETGWVRTDRTVWDVLLWLSVGLFKMVFGILVIFAWRLIAKFLLHQILPPTFRFLAKMFKLPSRRFYTPATDYKNVESEGGLRPIPSVIDLATAGEEIGGIGSGDGTSREGLVLRNRHDRLRHAKKANELNEKEHARSEEDEDKPRVKHYDADVLTKVTVYSGIALLACEVVPLVFDLVGLGVRSWPSHQ